MGRAAHAVKMVNTDAIAFSSDLDSTFHQQHQPKNTIILSQPALHTALPDLENLFGDAKFQTTQTNIKSSQWSAPTGTTASLVTRLQQPSILPAQTTLAESENDSLGAAYQSLPKDAKIGIIVGIVVVVSLSLLGCGMCFLDCRRRQRRRKERRQNRDAELIMLETEMRSGQTELQKRDRKGLWDHLKPTSGDGDSVVADIEPGYVQEVTTKPEQVVRKDSAIGSTRHGSGAGWSPMHIPNNRSDRSSIVSSVPSLTSLAGGRPGLPRNFLDGGVRR